MDKKWIVVTTINQPTKAIESISKLAASGWSFVVVGDKKTPVDWGYENVHYISVDAQRDEFGLLAELLPYNHYCRKNLGYLYAISRGANIILETDDDNIPYDNFGFGISANLTARIVKGSEWINVYKYFTNENIWPRGLPLDEIRSVGFASEEVVSSVYTIQQFLADSDPDVDAVYRLVFDKEVVFKQNEPLGIDKGCWVPFNSQNTVFFADAFPLLYLPCHVSFRMTDIWRSFVAQQALWIFDQRMAFLPATVKQVRNEHDLMKDFADEIPGYMNNKRIVRVLSEKAMTLSASMGMYAVVRSLWEALNMAGVIPDVEMEIIDNWMAHAEAVVESRIIR